MTSAAIGALVLPPKRRYLSTAAVAGRLGLSARTVRLWAECGEIPAVKAGRQWRISESVLEEWLTPGHSQLPDLLRK